MKIEALIKALHPETIGYKLMPNLEVKAIKKFKGHDGADLSQGNLYLNNKKIAFIGEDSWNGAMNLEVFNKEAFEEVEKWIKDAKITYTSECFPETMKIDTELYLTELLVSTSLLVDVRRTRKTKTWIKKGREYYTYNAPFSEAFQKEYENSLKQEGEIVLNTFL